MLPSEDLNQIFDIITKDESFVDLIQSSIEGIMSDGRVDIHDTPAIIRIIVNVLRYQPTVDMEPNDLAELVRLLFDHFAVANNLFRDEETIEKVGRIVESSVALLMMQPMINRPISRCMSGLSVRWPKLLSCIKL